MQRNFKQAKTRPAAKPTKNTPSSTLSKDGCDTEKQGTSFDHEQHMYKVSGFYIK